MDINEFPQQKESAKGLSMGSAELTDKEITIISDQSVEDFSSEKISNLSIHFARLILAADKAKNGQ